MVADPQEVTVKQASRRVVAAILALSLVSCTAWGRPASLGRDHLAKRPSRLRVALTDGRRLDVVRPTARGDTLFGDTLIWQLSGDWATRGPVAIPFAEVRSVSARQFSAGRTAVFVVGVMAFVGGAAFVVVDGIARSLP